MIEPLEQPYYGIGDYRTDKINEIVEYINKKEYFDWQSFRNQAAKDILCSIIRSGYYGENRVAYHSELAVKYANELCKQLKEKEEK